MHNLFIKFILESINSDTKSRCLLTYLRLMNIASKRAGRFSIEDFECTGVQKRTFKKHIEKMVIWEWVTALPNGTYQIKNQLKIIEKKRGWCYKFSNAELNEFSHAKIASFRAFISELVLSYYKDVSQKAIIRGFKGSVIVGHNGFTYNTDRYTVKDPSLSQMDNFVGVKYSSAKTSKSISTICNYRKLCKKYSLYSNKFIVVNESYYKQLDNCTLSNLNEYNGILGRFLYGKNNTLLFSTLSKRTSKIELFKKR